MNNMIAFILGVITGGLGVGMYYYRQASALRSIMVDKLVVNSTLKEYLKTQDKVNAKKAKTKASRKKGVEQKR